MNDREQLGPGWQDVVPGPGALPQHRLGVGMTERFAQERVNGVARLVSPPNHWSVARVREPPDLALLKGVNDDERTLVMLGEQYLAAAPRTRRVGVGHDRK